MLDMDIVQYGSFFGSQIYSRTQVSLVSVCWVLQVVSRQWLYYVEVMNSEVFQNCGMIYLHQSTVARIVSTFEHYVLVRNNCSVN